MTEEEILNFYATITVPRDLDKRELPEEKHWGQFIRGWNDATIRHQNYKKRTLDFLTWCNLGFRFGKHFEGRHEDEIREAWETLVKHYERISN